MLKTAITGARTGACLAASLAALMATNPLSAQAQETTALTINGVTAYDGTELLLFAASAAAERHGTVTAEQVAEIVQRIYAEDGYFLADVGVTPDGRGIVVDEGVIASVSVEGTDPRTFDRVRGYFDPLIGRPAPNIHRFERAVLLADDLETIAVTADVDATDPAGAQVRLVATPEAGSAGAITLDNPARAFGDALTLSFNQEYYAAMQPGDLLRLSLTHTEGFDPQDRETLGALTYRAPVGTGGGYVEGYVANIAAQHDAFGTLQQTDREGLTAILAYGYPVLRSVDRYAYSVLELRGARTEVVVGTQRFDSELYALSASWIDGRALADGGALEYALDLTAGEQASVPAGLDAGDRTFWYLRAGLDFEIPMTVLPDASLRFDATAQVTTARLPAAEEYVLGGQEELRGFPFAEAQGDSGLSFALSAGRDFLPTSGVVQRIRPFVFIDAGRIWNNQPSASETSAISLASAGAGVEMQIDGNFYLRGHLGFPLTDGVTQRTSDPAIYLGLTRSW
ncbi:ShlB/FhaC/HecB family hemolysin secretion/activation protein [Roseicyclus marinus]|uniref:ShlB/FhaC/HecB family hemolysin secretion/activation protein n=1 Tax=Roseicyclus marinus TaxID=2161673 RepID=UPI00240FB4AC|nr:ShlB/FhaC/HecB family hemolysin secretion/activation protein [Roseicyclus marinus]MDG3043027.1 ShlB/FhaC/HecB family hemolysin secretion/activation protein [Roseicyclus marinus]